MSTSTSPKGSSPDRGGKQHVAYTDRELPPTVFLRCFVRSLFLQATWNSRGMQNVGFLYAMWPALERLYPDGPSRREAFSRHLEPFNTQPYMAEAVLGGTIHHEMAIAMGRASPARVLGFKSALAGPLAALGDTFFWAGLRPATALLGVLLAPILGVWAILAFLVAYNIVHLAARAYLFTAGIRLGDGVLDAVGSLKLAERAGLVKKTAAVLLGIAVAAQLAAQTMYLGYPQPWSPILLVLVGALVVKPAKLLRHPYLLLLAMAGLGVLLGVVGTAVTGMP